LIRCSKDDKKYMEEKKSYSTPTRRESPSLIVSRQAQAPQKAELATCVRSRAGERPSLTWPTPTCGFGEWIWYECHEGGGNP
jgi:hypothetical protein